MAEAEKHSTGSGIATTGWETVKGGVLGALGVGVVGGLLGGLVVGGLTAIFASATTALVVGGVAAAASGVASLVGGAGLGAIIGGALGFAKGADKVNHENQIYHDRVEHRSRRREQEVNNAGMAGMQQGYQIGFVEAQQQMQNQLRAYQEEQLAAQAAQAKGGHAAKIVKQREAQAAAGPQVG